MTSHAERALSYIGTLTLPDGRALAETLPDDPWIVRDVLTPILEQGEDGRPTHRQLWIELHRGASKTSIAAAAAIAEALLEPATQVVTFAADLDQAALLTEAIEGQRLRNETLAKALAVAKDGYRVISTGSRIRVMSSDAPSAYGLGVNARRLRIICDELTQWRGREVYDAALTSLPKVADSQLIVITNAGVRGSWQEKARTAVESSGGYVYAPPGVLASWIKQEDLELVRANLPDVVYQRYYENRWTDSASGLFTRDMLAQCIDSGLAPRMRGLPDVVYSAGVDLGLVHDRTVRAIVHYDERADEVVLDNLTVWQGTKAEPVVIASIEQDIEFTAKWFNRPLTYLDPYELQSTFQRLGERLNIEKYSFTSESVRRLSETLFGLIRSRKLRLYPDPELEEELLALESVQTSYGWRIDHKPGHFSDRAMALGLACMAALSGQENSEAFWVSAGEGYSGGLRSDELPEPGQIFMPPWSTWRSIGGL